MPRTRKVGRRTRKMIGKGRILSWIKAAASKVDGFLKKTKILSKISSNFTGTPYGMAANTALSAIGYGKRRVGCGLKLSGDGRRRRGRGVVLSGSGSIMA